jgi:hypothetical protein
VIGFFVPPPPKPLGHICTSPQFPLLLLLPLPLPSFTNHPHPHTSPIHPSFTTPIIIPPPCTILSVVITSSTRHITCITSNRGKLSFSLSLALSHFPYSPTTCLFCTKGTTLSTSRRNGLNAIGEGGKKIGSIFRFNSSRHNLSLLPWGIYFIHPKCTPTVACHFFFFVVCAVSLSLPVCVC